MSEQTEERQFESDVRSLSLEMDALRSAVVAGRIRAASEDLARDGSLVQRVARLFVDVAEGCGENAQALLAAGVIARWIFDDAARVSSEILRDKNEGVQAGSPSSEKKGGMSFKSLGLDVSEVSGSRIPPKAGGN